MVDMRGERGMGVWWVGEVREGWGYGGWER